MGFPLSWCSTKTRSVRCFTFEFDYTALLLTESTRVSLTHFVLFSPTVVDLWVANY